jgi:NADH dehydrogenase
MQNKKTIVVLGGGFGGLNVVIGLAKRTSPEDTEIILVDKENYHLYYPNLYKIASTEEEFATIQDLKDSVIIPFAKVLPKGVKLICGNVEVIKKNNSVVVSGKEIKFDYLVVALGSVSDYFGIPGLAENSVALKSVNDALKIKNAVEFLVQSHRQDSIKKLLRIVVAGGGFTGVELAGELVNLINWVSWKNNYPLDRIQIEIIEGSNQLLPGMPSVISSAVFYRLKNFNVNVMLNSMITGVTPKQMNLNNGEVVNYDLLIWAGGVKSIDLPFEGEIKTDRKHRCMTEADLTMVGASNIYLIGDNACVMDQSKNPLPQTATQAIMHADYVARALSARLKNKPAPKFHSKPSSFIIPVKGKWAVLCLSNGFIMTGFIPWLANRFAQARYYNKVRPTTRTSTPDLVGGKWIN